MDTGTKTMVSVAGILALALFVWKTDVKSVVLPETPKADTTPVTNPLTKDDLTAFNKEVKDLKDEVLEIKKKGVKIDITAFEGALKKVVSVDQLTALKKDIFEKIAEHDNEVRVQRERADKEANAAKMAADNLVALQRKVSKKTAELEFRQHIDNLMKEHREGVADKEQYWKDWYDALRGEVAQDQSLSPEAKLESALQITQREKDFMDGVLVKDPITGKVGRMRSFRQDNAEFLRTKQRQLELLYAWKRPK